jgi:hypothetical protein
MSARDCATCFATGRALADPSSRVATPPPTEHGQSSQQEGGVIVGATGDAATATARAARRAEPYVAPDGLGPVVEHDLVAIAIFAFGRLPARAND